MHTIFATRQKIEDQIITALEGGSNYWCSISKEEIEKIIREVVLEGIPFSEKIFRYCYDLEKSVEIRDFENVDEVLGVLSKKSMLRAIDLIKERYPHFYDEINNEDGDASTADVFFQLAVMGELVFG